MFPQTPVEALCDRTPGTRGMRRAKDAERIDALGGGTSQLVGNVAFLSKWPWSTEEVAITWMKRFRERMEHEIEAEHQRLKKEMPKRIGRPKATVVTGYLIFDNLVHTKPKGRRMGGLGCHYSSAEQRNVKGHCLFTGFYVLWDNAVPCRCRCIGRKAFAIRKA